MKILANPVLLAVLALLSGTAAGLYPIWKAGEKLVVQTHTIHRIVDAEKKSQGWDFWTIEIDNLASELKEEKERLKRESELLGQRSARLDAERLELDKVRTSIEAMRKEIGEKVVEISTDESKNLRSLAQTYTNLTPRAAVAIIREMDDITVVKILALMKPDVVAPIFEEMSRTADKDGVLAKRAAVLSEKIRLLKSAKPANPS